MWNIGYLSMLAWKLLLILTGALISLHKGIFFRLWQAQISVSLSILSKGIMCPNAFRQLTLLFIYPWCWKNTFPSIRHVRQQNIDADITPPVCVVRYKSKTYTSCTIMGLMHLHVYTMIKFPIIPFDASQSNLSSFTKVIAKKLPMKHIFICYPEFFQVQ